MRPGPPPRPRILLVLLACAVVVTAGCATVPPGSPAPGGTGAPTGSSSPGGAPDGTLEVHFLNVGQAASILVVGPTGETMLVDSGHYRDDGEHVLDYLQRRGIDRIDYLVSSHAHADHVGGHAAVVEHYETEADGIGAIYDPGIVTTTGTYDRYLDAVEEHDVTLYETRAGDEIPVEGAEVAVLGPPDPYLASRDVDENSVVLHLTFGATSFLLTGDAADAGEEYLVETYGARLEATVLKAGHHGSSTSTGEALLDAVDPEAVVISSAYDSRYGHPHEAVLQRLDDRDVPAYWTATHGNTVLVSDGERVAVETQRPAPTGPLDLREGEPIEPGSTEPVERRTTIGPDDDGSGTDPAPAAATVAAGAWAVVALARPGPRPERRW